MESVPPAAGCARPPPSVASAEGRGLRKLHVSQFNLKLQPHMHWLTCTCRLKCYLVKVYLILLFLAGEVSSQESIPPREFGPCYRPMLFKAHVMPRLLVCIHAKVNIYFVTLQTRRQCFYHSLSPTGHLGLQARLRSIPLSIWISAQIANSCNVLILYQIRNLKSYCGSVLGI